MAKSSKTPCTTRNLQGIRIIDTPPHRCFLVDSPGVMIPRIKDQETALKLSLVGCIKDVISGKTQILDYLVASLNKQRVQKYMHYYKLEKPASDGAELFHHVRDKYRHYNYEVTFDRIIQDFREGTLGNITFDDISELDL